MPPARCAPIVKNNLIVTTPFASNGQIMSQSFHLTADLPKSGSRFDVTSIIGRCVSPCSCVNNDLSNKVCGADGRTYDSECDARCAGISVSLVIQIMRNYNQTRENCSWSYVICTSNCMHSMEHHFLCES